MKNNIVFIAILAVIVGGAGGFFGGMQYQKSQRASFAGNTAGFAARGLNGTPGVRGRNGNGLILLCERPVAQAVHPEQVEVEIPLEIKKGQKINDYPDVIVGVFVTI